MNSTSAASSDPGGSPAKMAKWKDTVGIAANAVAIAAALSPLLPLIQASPYYMVAAYVVAAMGGFYSLFWFMGREPKKIFHYVMGMISSIVITISLLFVSQSTLAARSPPYFIIVQVYAYDKDDVGNTRHPLQQFSVVALDQYHRPPATFKTDENGLRLIPVETDGPIYNGVCGVFEMQTISKTNNSRETAYPMHIAIDQTRLSSCSE